VPVVKLELGTAPHCAVAESADSDVTVVNAIRCISRGQRWNFEQTLKVEFDGPGVGDPLWLFLRRLISILVRPS
jgi:hypothetical protein